MNNLPRIDCSERTCSDILGGLIWSQSMKIGILETGILNPKLAHKFDPYPVMFAALIDRSGHSFEYRTYSVIRGEMPDSIDECDGWLITGSRHGVYEHLDWMQKLEGFIRSIAEQKIPLVGICFGHQIIAQALGGEVVKSDQGWGVGLHRYNIAGTQNWMRSPASQIGIYAFHQDQVVTKPESAAIFLSSEFCPIAGLIYGDSIISVQAHPEFAPVYEQALLDTYGGDIVPADIVEKAESTMQGGGAADTDVLAGWIGDFFLARQSLPTAQAGSN
ncbi:MAG: GMP synthase-like glutamine amidotransferase [Planctomycetota bacterium]|jgi:GMP synthase-like glutamine amidotransferase